MSTNLEPWIGVDLDGTLVFHDHRTFHYAHIGVPIMPMVRRIQSWLASGKKVKLMTARYGLPEPEVREFLEAWATFSTEHFGQVLEVTDRKDFRMLELWDDRAVQVVLNTGSPVRGS